MKRLSYIIVLVALVWFTSLAQFENYQQYHITQEDGLPDITVTAIFQDSRGFIWLGSRTGLYQYNGYDYRLFEYVFDDTTSISSNIIYRILEDESGNLWITTSAGLNKFNRSKETFTRFQHTPFIDKKSDHDLIGMTPGKTGKLLLSTWHGELLELDMKTETYIKIILAPGNKKFSMNSEVTDIKTDKDDRLWMGTWGEGLFVFDMNNNYELIHHFHHIKNNPKSIRNDTLLGIYIDNIGKIYIGTQVGLDVINTKSSNLKQSNVSPLNLQLPEMPNLGKNAIYEIKEDNTGILWIRSHHGIIAYDSKIGKSKIWTFSPEALNSFGKFSGMKSLVIDNTGVIWSSRLFNGISRIKYQRNNFGFIHHDSTNTNSLNNNKVTGVYQDTSGILWLGTRNHGLNKCIPAKGENNTETWLHYTHNPDDLTSISSNRTSNIFRDSRGDLWIGTYDGGINKLIELGNGQVQFKNYQPNIEEESQTDQLEIICEDKEANLWFGGEKLLLFDRDKEQFFQYVADLANTDSVPFNSRINAIVADSGSIWVATFSDGFFNISPPFKKTGSFITGTTKIYRDINERSGVLREWGIRSICAPTVYKENLLWIGTNGKGLLSLKKEKKKNGEDKEYFDIYTKKEGLPNLIVQGIEEDNDGNIWISTTNGLSKFDPETELFTNFFEEDGLADDIFKIGAHHKSPDGKLYFGVDGVISFYPDEIIPDDYIPPVYICNISISNIPLKAGDNSPLKQTISETKEITLSHEQNFITLEYAALNYNKSNNTQYKYMLEGFEKEWIDAGTERFARYHGLQPGKYTFRVIASNNDGIWDTKGATLKITITPPWWKSIPAIFSYILLLVLVIYSYIKLRERKLIQDKKVLEKKVKERTEELHEVNTQLVEHHEELEQQKEELQQTLDFLKETQSQLVQSEKMASVGQLTAGIAHEINNPVNYINAGIDSLKTNVKEIGQILDLYRSITIENVAEKLKVIQTEEEKIDIDETRNEIRNLIKSISNGAERTTEIVKGLRTFSRLDENEIKPADIHEGIDLTLVMLHNKYKHHIEVIKQYSELPMVDCYPGKLNQVFMNIISNAIDAINKKGTITIKTWEDKPNSNIFVSIKDTGMGMSESTRSNIFNPFYTTKEIGKGTGLGLSISHGIVEQHKGKIEVKSEPGKGAEFIISLPVKQVE